MGGELLRALVDRRLRGADHARAWVRRAQLGGAGDAGRVLELLGRHGRDAVLRRAGARPGRRPAVRGHGRARWASGRGRGARRSRRCRAGCSRGRRWGTCSGRWRARSPPAAWRAAGIARRVRPRGWTAVDRDAAAALGAGWRSTVPLIYGAGPMAAVAYRWKTQLNENAKMHAFSHAFPELDHNEIVAWEGAPRGLFAAVMLRDPGERAETRRMIEATAELIGQDAVLRRARRGARRHGRRPRVLDGRPRRLGQLPRGAGARRQPDAGRPDRHAQAAHRRAIARDDMWQRALGTLRRRSGCQPPTRAAVRQDAAVRATGRHRLGVDRLDGAAVTSGAASSTMYRTGGI